jgi:hypothetical protein
MNFSEFERHSDLSDLAREAGRTDDVEKSIEEIGDIR